MPGCRIHSAARALTVALAIAAQAVGARPASAQQSAPPPEGPIRWVVEPAQATPLTDVIQILPGEDLADPRWAPGMRYIGVTRKDRRGLWVVRLTDGKVLRISSAYGSGKDYAFSFDGTKILFSVREPENLSELHAGRRRWIFHIMDLDRETLIHKGPVEKGFLSLSWFRPTEFQTVVRHDGMIEVRHYISSDLLPAFEKGRMQRWGVVGVTESIGTLWKMRADHTRREFRYETPPNLLNPNLSHNQRVIAAQSSEGNAYLIGTATDLVVDLGEGQNVRWGWWYDKVVFERVQMQGHSVTGSEIILADLKTLKSYNLSQSPGLVERFPDLSLNQKWVTFVRPDGLYIGRVPQFGTK